MRPCCILMKALLFFLLWHNSFANGESSADIESAIQNITDALENLVKQDTILSNTEIPRSLIKSVSVLGNILNDTYQSDTNISSNYKDMLINAFSKLDIQMTDAVKETLKSQKRRGLETVLFEDIHLPLIKFQKAFKNIIENFAQEDIELFKKTCIRESPLEQLNKVIIVKSKITDNQIYADKYFKKFIVFYPLCNALMLDTLPDTVVDPETQYRLVESRVETYYEQQKPIRPFLV